MWVSASSSPSRFVKGGLYLSTVRTAMMFPLQRQKTRDCGEKHIKLSFGFLHRVCSEGRAFLINSRKVMSCIMFSVFSFVVGNIPKKLNLYLTLRIYFFMDRSFQVLFLLSFWGTTSVSDKFAGEMGNGVGICRNAALQASTHWCGF